MNRKQFILSHGASCDNWNWSWSFINKEKKIIIFGAWDVLMKGNAALIMSEEWQKDLSGKKKAGYKQSLEHIRLLEKEGYNLKIFPMKYSASSEGANGLGPAKIGGFEPLIEDRTLMRIEKDWYAVDDKYDTPLPEEIYGPEQFIEGASVSVTVNSFERSADARLKCIEYHGFKCAVCGFNFYEKYGSIGNKYIHVHHIIALSDIRKEYSLDPIKDLIPICPNCHAMLHKTRPAMTVEMLKGCLQAKATTN